MGINYGERSNTMKNRSQDAMTKIPLGDYLGPVIRSMVSADHWLSSIKINRLSWYLPVVSANQALSNSAQNAKKLPTDVFAGR